MTQCARKDQTVPCSGGLWLGTYRKRDGRGSSTGDPIREVRCWEHLHGPIMYFVGAQGYEDDGWRQMAIVDWERLEAAA